MNNMNRVVAVVVTYNRKDLLKKCVERLLNQTVPLDIMVVDNASTDGTGLLFEEEKDNILYYNTGANLGGAGGFSYGIRKAVELGYEFLWVLDDDTMPTETALERFLNKDKELHGEYGFLSSKVLWKDGNICEMNIQKSSKWGRIKDFNHDQPVQYASFVSMFLKADVVKEVGLPYKEFFIWADDWEYTRRISKNKKCYFVSSSVVDHWCNSNVGASIITADIDRMDRFNYMYRNDVVMYRQDGFEGWIYLTIRNLLHKIRIIKDGKNISEKIRLINAANAEGKNFYPEIEYPRN